MQDLIIALDALLDQIFEPAIQPSFSALKQTGLSCGRPFHKRSMVLTKMIYHVDQA